MIARDGLGARLLHPHILPPLDSGSIDI